MISNFSTENSEIANCDMFEAILPSWKILPKQHYSFNDFFPNDLEEDVFFNYNFKKVTKELLNFPSVCITIFIFLHITFNKKYQIKKFTKSVTYITMKSDAVLV